MAYTTSEDELIRRAGYTIYSRLKGEEPVWREVTTARKCRTVSPWAWRNYTRLIGRKPRQSDMAKPTPEPADGGYRVEGIAMVDGYRVTASPQIFGRIVWGRQQAEYIAELLRSLGWIRVRVLYVCDNHI